MTRELRMENGEAVPVHSPELRLKCPECAALREYDRSPDDGQTVRCGECGSRVSKRLLRDINADEQA
jgi:DNA-directed RNA polymerase subunit RPC12/RpoP